MAHPMHDHDVALALAAGAVGVLFAIECLPDRFARYRSMAIAVVIGVACFVDWPLARCIGVYAAGVFVGMQRRGPRPVRSRPVVPVAAKEESAVPVSPPPTPPREEPHEEPATDASGTHDTGDLYEQIGEFPCSHGQECSARAKEQ